MLPHSSQDSLHDKTKQSTAGRTYSKPILSVEELLHGFYDNTLVLGEIVYISFCILYQGRLSHLRSVKQFGRPKETRIIEYLLFHTPSRFECISIYKDYNERLVAL